MPSTETSKYTLAAHKIICILASTANMADVDANTFSYETLFDSYTDLLDQPENQQLYNQFMQRSMKMVERALIIRHVSNEAKREFNSRQATNMDIPWIMLRVVFTAISSNSAGVRRYGRLCEEYDSLKNVYDELKTVTAENNDLRIRLIYECMQKRRNFFELFFGYLEDVHNDYTRLYYKGAATVIKDEFISAHSSSQISATKLNIFNREYNDAMTVAESDADAFYLAYKETLLRLYRELIEDAAERRAAAIVQG